MQAWANENGQPCRTVDSYKKKFLLLAKQKPPTGQSAPSAEVKQAQELFREMMLESGGAVVDDDDKAERDEQRSEFTPSHPALHGPQVADAAQPARISRRRATSSELMDQFLVVTMATMLERKSSMNQNRSGEAPASSAEAAPAARSALMLKQELDDLKALLDSGMVAQEEFSDLRARSLAAYRK